MPKKQKIPQVYFVVLDRQYTSIASLRVEAGSKAEAEKFALDIAGTDPNLNWQTPLDLKGKFTVTHCELDETPEQQEQHSWPKFL